MVFGDAAEFAAYEALVAAFTGAQDDVTVSLSHIPSQGDYRARLASDFAAGTPPDVSLLNFRRAWVRSPPPTNSSRLALIWRPARSWPRRTSTPSPWRRSPGKTN